MAKLISKPTVSLELQLSISEGEARALDAIIGYGAEPFLKVFKEKLGSCYIEGHEKDVVSLFESLRSILPGVLSRADSAREFLKKQLKPPTAV